MLATLWAGKKVSRSNDLDVQFPAHANRETFRPEQGSSWAKQGLIGRQQGSALDHAIETFRGQHTLSTAAPLAQRWGGYMLASITKLRQVDVLVSQGASVADVVRSIAVTEVTY